MEKKQYIFRLKIAFVNITQGKVARGGETFVSELSQRLAKSNKVDILSGNRKLPERWPILWRVFLDPQGILVFIFTLKILPKIYKEKYDIVIPLNGGWQGALIRIITWLYGGKMLISGQSGIGWTDRNNLWCFPNCFVAISSKAKKWAKRANPWVKVRYIPNGVDLKKFRPTGEAFKTNLKKPIVICVGALVKSKRIELVIDAVSKIENASLLVVGRGPLKKKILKLGKDLLGDRFQLVAAKHKDMPKYYRAADAFILIPETSEAFGIVYLEAMASGLPVVAPKDEQREEIVADAGELVDEPEDSKEVVIAINEILKRKWGNIPRNQAEKFSWDEIARSYEKLFREM
jgi:glycosyltransferase involved in cell wall biosynthesis